MIARKAIKQRFMLITDEHMSLKPSFPLWVSAEHYSRNSGMPRTALEGSTRTEKIEM